MHDSLPFASLYDKLCMIVQTVQMHVFTYGRKKRRRRSNKELIKGTPQEFWLKSLDASDA